MADLSACAGAPVQVEFGLPELRETPLGESIDGLDVEIDCYGPPQADFLAADAGEVVEETLVSALLKSNCPVTGQPDWATVSLRYRGPKIDRAGLLRYLVSYREHAEFHEQCVERIFSEVSARCRPHWLEVEARYTRRGGLDINPWRASPASPPRLRPTASCGSNRRSRIPVVPGHARRAPASGRHYHGSQAVAVVPAAGRQSAKAGSRGTAGQRTALPGVHSPIVQPPRAASHLHHPHLTTAMAPCQSRSHADGSCG